MDILVGVDGSTAADRALAWALREAGLHRARVRAVNAFRVHEFAGMFNRDVPLDKRRAGARDVVEQALARVAGAGHDDIEVTTSAVTGRGAADAILRHRGETDLIVVGSRGLGGFPGLLLGSVSHQIAAHADVPVAVIPAEGEQRSDDRDGVRSIVVGVDGSAASVHAFRWAVNEARVRDVQVTAVYAYRSLREGSPFDAFASIDPEQLSALERSASTTALRKLDALLDEIDGDTSGVTVEHRVESGRPGRVLTCDAADETNLLVVGSRGHGGFRGLLLGSVSQQCLHHARGPVVVTPVVH